MLLLTADEMRALDRLTIERGHASGEELMERAGAGVVAAMERRYGSTLGMRVLVLCGTGNNGGDGFVAARHLHARGAVPRVLVLGQRSSIRGEARAHLEQLATTPCPVEEVAGEAALQQQIARPGGWDYALDALLGTGARGEPEGLMAAGVQALRELDEAGTEVVAVDLPTGVDADTGAIARRAVRADLTVTFGAPKRGHFLYPGRAFAGALEVVNIGLEAPERAGDRYAVEVGAAADLARLVPVRDPRAHKGSVGRVLVIGGSAGLTGAPVLSARAANRSGAGYIQCAVPASLHDIFEIKLTEETTLPMLETGARALALAAFDPIAERIASVHAVALGPGLSHEPEAAALARRLAAECPRPLVIDADALNALAGHTQEIARHAAPRVLTPHVGEMSRLTGRSAAEIEAGRIEIAREAAKGWGVIVVLKGAPTVTAHPDGRATVNPTGNPGMATLGMGDVLTGVIVALIAQGLEPYDAARLGVFVHGTAGDMAATVRGQLGMTAGDALEALPRAMLALTRAGPKT